jgi:hypothetical protein
LTQHDQAGYCPAFFLTLEIEPMKYIKPARATHFMTGVTDAPWRDLSGPTWAYLEPSGLWVDTGKDTASFIERNAHRLEDVTALPRDSSVADAALWLHLNRSAGRESWLRKTPPVVLIRIARGAQEHDERLASDPLAIIARLAESDSGNHYSEDECFVADRLLQEGAGIVDDDANVYAVTLAQVLALLKAYQAPAFTDAGPISLTCTVEMSEELRAAFATIQALQPGELVVATPGVSEWEVRDSDGYLVGSPEILARRDERIAELERALAGMLYEFDDGVNGGRGERVPALDHARTLVAATELKPQPPAFR